jgi:hypothetical protein
MSGRYLLTLLIILHLRRFPLFLIQFFWEEDEETGAGAG